MKFLHFVLVAAIMLLIGSAQAQVVYDFETLYTGLGVPNAGNRPDGFEGIGLTVAQSTTGATLNTHSMQMAMPAGDTFDAAHDDTPNTPGTDPNSLLFKASAINYDLTISASDPAFDGGFADLGVTAFYADNTDPAHETFGNQLQSSGFANVNLAPGLYHQTIALTSGAQTFGQFFSNPNFIPTGFQFFLNKGGGNNTAMTIYLDNVSAVVPEPASACLLLTGLGSLLAMRLRSR